MVQATKATAIRSATNASRKNHTILSRSLRSSAARAIGAAAALLILAGCATGPREAGRPEIAARPPPAAAPAAAGGRALVAGEVLARRLERASGLDRGQRRRNLARLSRRLRRARRVTATRAVWEPPCANANAVDAADRTAVRAFFERHFSPYLVTAADGRDTGMITGYYEPLLAGSRDPLRAQSRAAVRARRTIS